MDILDIDLESMMVDNANIVFLIHYGEHTIRVELSSDASVGILKTLLTRKTGLSNDDMELVGWNAAEVSDEDTFDELGIEKEYNLVLLAKNGEEEDREKASITYNIQVEDEENDETFVLYFNGLQTVHDVKVHVATLSPIPVDRQKWEHWPWPLKDDQTLLEIGLKTPTHKLKLNRIRDVRSPLVRIDERSNYLDTDNITEDEEDDEDDLETVVSASPSLATQRGSLIPDVTLPMSAAVDLFVQNFEQRYGDQHVTFFIGTIREAMSFAFDRSAAERQLLVIYLHHDKSISVNIFVSQILQSSLIIDHTNDRVVVWPWDVTSPDNRNIVRREMEEIFGMNGGFPVTYETDKFPLMFICAKMKGSIELLRTIDGSKSSTEVLHALEYAASVQSRAKTAEISEQEARNKNRMMVEEQNIAYQKSLEADQAKAEAKRLLEKQAVLAENDAKESVRQRERRQEDASASLPPEPSQGNGDSITIIRLKTPDGKNLTRRFSSSEPLSQLYKFALSSGYPPEEFKLVCSYPRKDLGELDQRKSLKELGLTQQIALFVEEH